MKCAVFSVASSLVSLFIVGATAGDFVADVQRDFAMGLFPRQVLATNLQAFTGALGGSVAPPITKSTDTSRPFEVDGDTFPDYATAAGRSCDNQKNACADIANKNQGGTLTVSQCDTQNTQCKAAATTATTNSFATLTSSTAEFDIFCE